MHTATIETNKTKQCKKQLTRKTFKKINLNYKLKISSTKDKTDI